GSPPKRGQSSPPVPRRLATALRAWLRSCRGTGCDGARLCRRREDEGSHHGACVIRREELGRETNSLSVGRRGQPPGPRELHVQARQGTARDGKLTGDALPVGRESRELVEQSPQG